MNDMTSRKDIDDQIQRDYEAFYNKYYDEGPEVPKGTVDIFRKALMAIHPNAHQIHVDKMKIMCSTPENTLTFVQVGIMINVILMAIPNELYESFDQFLEHQQRYEEIKIFYNKRVDEMNKKLQSKHNKLMEIAGLVKGTLSLTK